MAANRLPASLMNALDPAAGARRSRLTAARAGAPRCPYISRRSRPASGQTLTVPSSFRRGELPRRLRAPFARNVILGAYAADRARGHSHCQPHGFAVRRCGSSASGERPADRGSRPGGTRVPTEPNLAAFCQGLRSLGYVEGENIAVEYRHALGNDKAYAEHAAEFVRLKVDVMVVGSGVPTRAALGLAGAPPTVDPRGAKK